MMFRDTGWWLKIAAAGVARLMTASRTHWTAVRRKARVCGGTIVNPLIWFPILQFHGELCKSKSFVWVSAAAVLIPHGWVLALG